jgi:hypothetical protein
MNTMVMYLALMGIMIKNLVNHYLVVLKYIIIKNLDKNYINDTLFFYM